jgi:hypothetical protein
MSAEIKGSASLNTEARHWTWSLISSIHVPSTYSTSLKSTLMLSCRLHLLSKRINCGDTCYYSVRKLFPLRLHSRTINLSGFYFERKSNLTSVWKQNVQENIFTVHPLLGNVLVNEFPLRQILDKESVTTLRNNRGGCVFHVTHAKQQ